MDKKIEKFQEKMNTFLGVIKEKDNIILNVNFVEKNRKVMKK